MRRGSAPGAQPPRGRNRRRERNAGSCATEAHVRIGLLCGKMPEGHPAPAVTTNSSFYAAVSPLRRPQRVDVDEWGARHAARVEVHRSLEVGELSCALWVCPTPTPRACDPLANKPWTSKRVTLSREGLENFAPRGAEQRGGVTMPWSVCRAPLTSSVAARGSPGCRRFRTPSIEPGRCRCCSWPPKPPVRAGRAQIARLG